MPQAKRRDDDVLSIQVADLSPDQAASLKPAPGHPESDFHAEAFAELEVADVTDEEVLDSEKKSPRFPELSDARQMKILEQFQSSTLPGDEITHETAELGKQVADMSAGELETLVTRSMFKAMDAWQAQQTPEPEPQQDEQLAQEIESLLADMSVEDIQEMVGRAVENMSAEELDSLIEQMQEQIDQTAEQSPANDNAQGHERDSLFGAEQPEQEYSREREREIERD